MKFDLDEIQQQVEAGNDILDAYIELNLVRANDETDRRDFGTRVSGRSSCRLRLSQSASIIAPVSICTASLTVRCCTDRQFSAHRVLAGDWNEGADMYRKTVEDFAEDEDADGLPESWNYVSGTCAAAS